MDLATLLNSESNISVNVSVATLREFAIMVVEEYTAKQLEGKAAQDAETQEQQKAKEFISAKEVCQMLGISETTLWRYDKEQSTCPVKVGGRRTYKRTDIERLLK